MNGLHTLNLRDGLFTVNYYQNGKGSALVYLHGAGGLPAFTPDLELLSQRFAVTAPLHPGFGSTGEEHLHDEVLKLTLHTWDVLDALGINEPTRAYSAEGHTPEHRSREAQRAACRSAARWRSRPPLEAASAESEGPISPIIQARASGGCWRGEGQGVLLLLKSIPSPRCWASGGSGRQRASFPEFICGVGTSSGGK